jgi:DNA-binding GntR family transcriptional regulator
VVGSARLAVRTRFLARPEARGWPVPFLYPLSESEAEAGCVFLQRLRCVGRDPVMLENTYVPDFGMAELRRRPFVQGSLFRTLSERHGIEVIALDQELRAVGADAFTAECLRIRRGAAVLHIRRRYRTSRDGFHLYGSLFCHTGKYAIGNGFAS